MGKTPVVDCLSRVSATDFLSYLVKSEYFWGYTDLSNMVQRGLIKRVLEPGFLAPLVPCVWTPHSSESPVSPVESSGSRTLVLP